jgi:CO/xanthine dehydrogenase FAD-binding subunit
MKLAPFELRSPATLGEALAQLSVLGSDAQVLAGGQSLLPLLRYRVIQPHVLLDINRIEALSQLQLGDDGVRIGALVRHATLEQAARLAPGLPLAQLIAAHARGIAFHAVRNRGTLVGSLLQADPKGDWPLLACALDAQIELASARGLRSVPVREFILGPLLTARAVDELATALTLTAAQAPLSAWGRAKLMHRAGEYATCAAIALRREAQWSCWLGAVGDKPSSLPTLAQALDALALPLPTSPQTPATDRRDPLDTPGREARETLAAARPALVAAATHDVAAAAPELGRVELHRHAVNAVDAAADALRPLATPTGIAS